MYINTNQDLEELRIHGTPGFPFEICYVDFSDYPNHTVSNHWHSELEINYIVQGKVRTMVNGTESVIEAGEAVFINSNAFHMAQEVPSNTAAIQYSIVFSPQFLAGVTTDIYHKYVSPYIYDSACSSIWLQKQEDGYWNGLMDSIDNIIRLYQHKPDTYELEIHILLCQMWQQIISYGFGKKTEKLNSIQLERMRQMLTFLQAHYMNPITIEEIAGAANVSRSECFRCFQKVLKQKPFEYLINLRLEQAAGDLLSSTRSVSEIAGSCGINHQSYFGKLFKEKYGCSPTVYRTNSSRTSQDLLENQR